MRPIFYSLNDFPLALTCFLLFVRPPRRFLDISLFSVGWCFRPQTCSVLQSGEKNYFEEWRGSGARCWCGVSEACQTECRWQKCAEKEEALPDRIDASESKPRLLPTHVFCADDSWFFHKVCGPCLSRRSSPCSWYFKRGRVKFKWWNVSSMRSNYDVSVISQQSSGPESTRLSTWKG